MNVEKALYERGGHRCELCGNNENTGVYEVPPNSKGGIDDSVLICNTCKEQIDHADRIDPDHWRCLNESMWSQVPAVQVMAWRMLNRLAAEAWPQELLDMLYLEDDVLAWARAGLAVDASDDVVEHRDTNGALLEAGDTVILTRDLNVKGAGFTAKRGTAVRGISLVADNAKQIEGRVNGQRIVILCEFVKKSG